MQTPQCQRQWPSRGSSAAKAELPCTPRGLHRGFRLAALQGLNHKPPPLQNVQHAVLGLEEYMILRRMRSHGSYTTCRGQLAQVTNMGEQQRFQADIYIIAVLEGGDPLGALAFTSTSNAEKQSLIRMFMSQCLRSVWSRPPRSIITSVFQGPEC